MDLQEFLDLIVMLVAYGLILTVGLYVIYELTQIISKVVDKIRNIGRKVKSE